MRLDERAGVDVWSSASWRDQAVSWLDARLAAAGIERTGDVEQPHIRPWATALAAPTTRGQVWLKAAGPETAFEVGLYELLNRIVPDRVLNPIATDVRRGWIVLPDGGTPLAERHTGLDLVQPMVKIVPRYGQLQRALSPHVDSLLALGVSDMRAAMMLTRFDEAVAAVGEQVERTGSEADKTVPRKVPAMRDTFADWCNQLTEAPVTASLDHNDLHAWNIFVTGEDTHLDVRFYDWGDSVVAHPFASLLVGLGFLQDHLGVRVPPRQIRRVRDAYLEVFTDLAPRAELVETLELACRVGKVARALTWNRALRMRGPHAEDEFLDAPQRCLRSLLDDSYLGGA